MSRVVESAISHINIACGNFATHCAETSGSAATPVLFSVSRPDTAHEFAVQLTRLLTVLADIHFVCSIDVQCLCSHKQSSLTAAHSSSDRIHLQNAPRHIGANVSTVRPSLSVHFINLTVLGWHHPSTITMAATSPPGVGLAEKEVVSASTVAAAMRTSMQVLSRQQWGENNGSQEMVITAHNVTKLTAPHAVVHMCTTAPAAASSARCVFLFAAKRAWSFFSAVLLLLRIPAISVVLLASTLTLGVTATQYPDLSMTTGYTSGPNGFRAVGLDSVDYYGKCVTSVC